MTGDPTTLFLGALGTLAVATISAVLGAALSLRAKIDEGLRGARLKSYPQLWQHTATASRWPRTKLDFAQLAEFHKALRLWYYTDGGLFLSEHTRELYGSLQELNHWMLQNREHAGVISISEREYQQLMEACSSLRTAMTQDLQTRRTRPVLSIWQQSEQRRWRRNTQDAIMRTIIMAKDEAMARAEEVDHDKAERPQI